MSKPDWYYTLTAADSMNSQRSPSCAPTRASMSTLVMSITSPEKSTPYSCTVRLDSKVLLSSFLFIDTIHVWNPR